MSKSKNNQTGSVPGFVNDYVGLLSKSQTEESYKLFTNNLKKSISRETWADQNTSIAGKYPRKCDSIEVSKMENSAAAYGNSIVSRVVCELHYDDKPSALHLVIVQTDEGLLVDDMVMYLK